MLNLGYLPGGSERIVTRPETTLQCLESALELLSSDGVITVMCYRGHPGGDEETAAVRTYLGGLLRGRFGVTETTPVNASAPTPVLLTVERHATAD